MTRVVFRLLLQLLPRDRRDRDAAAMTAVFLDLLDVTRRREGLRGVAGLWLREAGGLLRFGIRERFARRHVHVLPVLQTPQPAHERSTQMLPGLLQDCRLALRGLRARPGFTAVAVLTMALAIGATTAVFSAVNAVLLRPFGFTDEERLLFITHDDGQGGVNGSTTAGSFYDWLAGQTTLDSFTAFSGRFSTVRTADRAEQVAGIPTLGSLFDTLGVRAALGRTYTAQEDRPDAPAVIVLSHATWQRVFDGNPSIVGSSITLDGKPASVIGVMPASFTYPGTFADYWAPSRLNATERENRDQYGLQAVGRMKPGVTIEQVRTDLNRILDRLKHDYPQYNANVRLAIMPLRDAIVAGTTTQIYVLLGAVVLVLVIACVNLANLLLGRFSTRHREIAVRLALGAGRARLFRQFLTESLILAALGGAAGAGVGVALIAVLKSLLPPTLPRLSEMNLDAVVLAVTAATSLGSGLLFGSVPALVLAMRRPTSGLRQDQRTSTSRSGLRTGLVVSEVALAIMLLVGASLLVRSFAMMQRVDPGFSARSLVTFRLGRPAVTGDAREAFYDGLLDRLRGVSGVTSVALANNVPANGRGNSAWFNMMDRPVAANQTPPLALYRIVSLDYFKTIGLGLTRGRLLDSGDGLKRTRAVVVNETLARTFYPDRDPLGREIELGAPGNYLTPPSTIVGIVGDVHEAGLGSPVMPVVYMPHALMPGWSGFSFLLDTHAPAEMVIANARAITHEVDPGAPMTAVSTIGEVLDKSLIGTRSSMTLITMFAGTALVLTLVGVFGVLSHAVQQRARELGIRLALGARPTSLRWLVLKRGMGAIAAGAVIGLAGAWLLTTVLRGLLFDVTARDPWSFAAAALVLSACALVACDIPARRAARADPLQTLKLD